MSEPENQNADASKAPSPVAHASRLEQFISILRQHTVTPGSPAATLKLTKEDSVAILAALQKGPQNVSVDFMHDPRPIASVYEIGATDALCYRVGGKVYQRDVTKIVAYKEEPDLPYFAVYVMDGDAESIAVRLPAYNFGIGYLFT
jgi:hypothetical protein